MSCLQWQIKRDNAVAGCLERGAARKERLHIEKGKRLKAISFEALAFMEQLGKLERSTSHFEWAVLPAALEKHGAACFPLGSFDLLLLMIGRLILHASALLDKC